MAEKRALWALFKTIGGGLAVSIIYDHKPEKYEVFNHLCECSISKSTSDMMTDALCDGGQYNGKGESYLLQKVCANETLQTLNIN